MLAILFLVIGVFSRLIVHAPNFTPVLALALFGGVYLKKEQAVWLPIALMVISDLFVGMHNMVALTWGSVLLISLLGYWQRERRSAGPILGMSLCSAVLFFVVTNFGAWIMMYPKTFAGLTQCYVLAIPFFRSTLVSTLVYSGVLFGLYEVVAHRVKETKFAWIT